MAETRTNTTTEQCPSCGGAARLVHEEREYRLGHLTAPVLDEHYQCEGACGEAYYTPEQADAVERQAVGRLHAQGQLLLPEEIRALRERLGLTQPEFERLLGVGTNTVSRWENGHVIPNAATDALLRLLEADPANARRLAEWHGVTLPHAA